MADEVLEEKEWTIEEYLALFDAGSPDHALIRQRSDRLKSVVVRRLRDPGGRLFEDTVFTERTGVSYTIRVRL